MESGAFAHGFCIIWAKNVTCDPEEMDWSCHWVTRMTDVFFPAFGDDKTVNSSTQGFQSVAYIVPVLGIPWVGC